MGICDPPTVGIVARFGGGLTVTFMIASSCCFVITLRPESEMPASG